MLVRGVLLFVLVALAAGHAARVAAVRDDPRGWGARLWPSHPSVQLNRIMAEVGASAARGQSLSEDTRRRVDEVASSAPLEPEPFLIKAALAQMAGREDQAERLFLAARARDPRSEAARFLLADRYLRSGRTTAALAEMSILARLLPNARTQLAPALASFAVTPGAVPQLRRLFRANPELEPFVLDQLARSPKHADLVMALWSGSRERQIGAPDWQAQLLDQLVKAQEYPRAARIWSRFTGATTPNSGVFNPEFRKLTAPPPFNWSFPPGGGVAESAGDGRLQVIFFGRKDAVLAEQLLQLAPGRYRLSMEVTGAAGDQASARWTVRCTAGERTLAELSIGNEQARRRLEANFVVPAGCAAQQLQLSATAGEFARTAEFTVSRLSLQGLSS